MANLIQLSDYKLYEGLSSSQHDDRLNKLITSVSALVKTYCNNSIIDNYSTADEEYFNIMAGESAVQVNRTPIRTDAGHQPVVSERNSPSESYTILTSGTDYYIDELTDTIYRISGTRARPFPAGMGSVKVNYKSGYSEVPKDLQLAVVDLVKYYFKDEKSTRKTLSGATIENQGSGDGRGFPDHIKRVLDLYKTY